jgi:hypothetical protein
MADHHHGRGPVLRVARFVRVGIPVIPTWPSDGDWPFFAAVAADLLADRERLYPGLIGKGTLSAEQAADGLRIMKAIVADWKRIAALYAGEEVGPCDATASAAEKDRELEGALARLRAILDRHAAALPASFHAGPSVRTDRVDCAGLDLDQLIAQVNEGRILAPDVHSAALVRSRLYAVAWMLERSRSRPSQMFHGKITAELRARSRQRQAA